MHHPNRSLDPFLRKEDESPVPEARSPAQTAETYGLKQDLQCLAGLLTTFH